MIKWIVDHASAGVLTVLFHIIVAIGALEVRVREAYYKLAGIPYYKGRGKFHDYVVRKSDVS
jgi:hypothetical protein